MTIKGFLNSLQKLGVEEIDTTKPLTIFDPTYTWKKTTFQNYTIKELQKPLFKNGECKYVPKSVIEKLTNLVIQA